MNGDKKITNIGDRQKDNRAVWKCLNCGYCDFRLFSDGTAECVECKTISMEMLCYMPEEPTP